jgi:hypothetical protein
MMLEQMCLSEEQERTAQPHSGTVAPKMPTATTVSNWAAVIVAGAT